MKSETLPDACPYCKKQTLKLDTERNGLFTITCYAWCGLGSPGFKTREKVFRWLELRKKYLTPKAA